MSTSTKAELEQRYIELLEKRIQQLERQLDEKPKSENSSDSTQNGTKDNNDGDGATGKDGERKGSRVRSVVSIFNFEKGIREDKPSDIRSKKSKDTSQFAFTFRTVISGVGLGRKEMGGFMYSEIDIQSPDLVELLKEVITKDGDYPGIGWEGQSVNMIGPFAPIVHYWDELSAQTEKQKGDSAERLRARDDLKELLEWVRGAEENEQYFKTRDQNLQSRTTTFDKLWTLFRPGTKAFAKPCMGMEQIFEIETPPDSWRDPKEMFVTCWYWDYVGEKLERNNIVFRIDKFRGTKDITSLPCYPLDYYRDENGDYSGDALIEKLRTRGRRFCEINRVKRGADQMFEYNGFDALLNDRSVLDRTKAKNDDDSDSEDTTKPEMPKVRTRKVNGRVIVDPDAFLKFGPGVSVLGDLNPKPVDEGFSRFLARDVSEDDKYPLCSPRVLGYATKEKAWGQFKVSRTDNVKRREEDEAFERDLQMEHKYKDLVRALVKHHKRTNDIIADKGQGVVILLHGGPGLGKTLTAESIALATGRPLFIVSVAEVGLDASKAEANLERMFYLASAWEAVLLVDEADVFLETRDKFLDSNRNALVSVLLRVLEYYQGIMLLTTNRLTSLDVAVLSRIHLAIRYKDLQANDIINIFSTFLKKADIDPEDKGDIERWVKRDATEYNLNGRQIRNIVTSAQALARSEKKLLTRDHLDDVLKMTDKFQRALQDVISQSRHNLGQTK